MSSWNKLLCCCSLIECDKMVPYLFAVLQPCHANNKKPSETWYVSPPCGQQLNSSTTLALWCMGTCTLWHVHPSASPPLFSDYVIYLFIHHGINYCSPTDVRNLCRFGECFEDGLLLRLFICNIVYSDQTTATMGLHLVRALRHVWSPSGHSLTLVHTRLNSPTRKIRACVNSNNYNCIHSTVNFRG